LWKNWGERKDEILPLQAEMSVKSEHFEEEKSSFEEKIDSLTSDLALAQNF